jgi:hypothetical protein
MDNITMSRRCARENIDAGTTNLWLVMLGDVQEQIGETKKRLADLEQSAAIIQEKVDLGEPFPDRLKEASTHF